MLTSNLIQPEEDLLWQTSEFHLHKNCKLIPFLIRDIPAGSVILVEPAVANICKEDQLESYCDFCFKNVDLRLIPCKSCAHVAYCNKKCLEKAFGMLKYMDTDFNYNHLLIIFRLLPQV